MKKPIFFGGATFYAEKRKYTNNATALYLADIKDGKQIEASINIPSLTLQDKQVVIKACAEQQKLLRTLINAQVISPPIGFVRVGFAHCPICKLLIP